jgi:hypothetical protein
LRRAARSGELSKERLDAAVGHVLELKRRLGLLSDSSLRRSRE